MINSGGNLSFNYDQVAGYIGYPCIFCESPEDAVDNLLRLIVNKECGYNEDTLFWYSTFQTILQGNYDLLELNKYGATFNEEEWRKILQEVIENLKFG